MLERYNSSEVTHNPRRPKLCAAVFLNQQDLTFWVGRELSKMSFVTDEYNTEICIVAGKHCLEMEKFHFYYVEAVVGQNEQ